jgi:predicted amidohydrolase YtcJ
MAELILHNGNFHTIDPGQTKAEAVAIDRGIIVAVGRDDEILPLAGTGTEVVNLNGKSVTPGLIDAHVHFERLASTLIRTDLLNVPSLEEVIRRVGQAAADKKPDEWVHGFGWSHDMWSDPSPPTAADLDRAAPHCPVLLDHKIFLHEAWVNSRALEIAGISAQTPDPPGGKIQRDKDGNPTGILFEEAVTLVSKQIPPLNTAKLAEAMIKAQEHCWQRGLVGLHDLDGESSFRALQWLNQRGELGMRIVKHLPSQLLNHAVALGLQSGFGDDFLRIGGIKIFADGAMGTRSALLSEPYGDNPHNYGIIVTDKESMMEQASLASEKGLSLAIHAIGDRAVHDVLDVLEQVRVQESRRGVQPQQLRHRIEHLQICPPADGARLAPLHLVASMNPVHVVSDRDVVDQVLGKRGRFTHAYRDILETGALVVFSSDAPFAAVDPWQGIMAAMMRQGPQSPFDQAWYPEQRLTLAEALYGFTMATAIASGQEQRQGSVSAGKLADLTIFDRDIFALAPEGYPEVTVAGTVVNGKVRYRAFA